MTLEQAEEIRKLLILRDNLVLQLKDFTGCESISGNINVGVNGLGFSWDSNSWQIKCLIEGTKKEIENIEETLKLQ